MLPRFLAPLHPSPSARCSRWTSPSCYRSPKAPGPVMVAAGDPGEREKAVGACDPDRASGALIEEAPGA